MPKKKKFKQDPSVTIQSFSKNLLGLKFMQRAKKEVERVKENDDYDDEDGGAFNSSPCAKLKNKKQCIINPSYQFCERLRFGRFSFKGMNMDIETIMYNNESERTAAEKRGAAEAEVDDEEEDDEEG